ncbi:DUF2515 family protein [Gorillibacterium sp. sgz5001074]|uniref:DUF2515 family protein n=1 Tax=Gorillibacterium sp. sgz5001074 TaxID=3446695 RepID=UPI003F676399
MQTNGSAGGGRPDWGRNMLNWLVSGAKLLQTKWDSWKTEGELLSLAGSLNVTREETARLRKEWSRILSSPPEPAAPAAEEKTLLNRIQQAAEAANRNNVTRTAAYWELYRKHPELHWAFLAHMVSRNGGWAMTDLQGELLPRILDRQERRDLFLFLERANALIFQDAYPQLLLYAESLKAGRPLFHLLPLLHVSAFMRPAWELFWANRNSSPALTLCLIINEQNYIQGRVVENGYYQKQVLNTLAFQAQSLLQLNQVFFPYRSGEDKGYRLAGAILEDFTSLDERIGIGKALYGILFGIPELRVSAAAFAAQHPHTGSRADYHPKLFSAVKKAPPSTSYTERLQGCGLRPGAYPLYSPPLQAAWKDHPVEKPERYDWFKDPKAASWLGSIRVPASFEMTADACTALQKIELAVLAAETVGLDEDGH